MAYISYFEKYRKYFDSLSGQEGIVEISKSLSNDSKNRANIINDSYINIISGSKWQELGKSIVVNKIMYNLNNKINRLNYFIENNLCQACDLAINTVLVNLKIIKVEDVNLKIMYDELAKLLTEFNNTPQYNYNWYQKADKNGVLQNYCDRNINQRYFELRELVKNQNLNLDSKETYIKRLCNEVNNAIIEILGLGNSSVSETSLTDMGLVYFQFKDANGIDFLEGEELFKFLKDNNISTMNTVVQKTEEFVNGVIFPVYYVYDSNAIRQDDGKLLKFGTDSLAYASLIDEKILQKIRNNDTAIIFVQTINCDNYVLNECDDLVSAYYGRSTKNITVLYTTESNAYDFYAKSIVHEFGHAYDYFLGKTNKIPTSSSLSADNFVRDILNPQKPYLWRELIEKDGANMLNASGEKFSYYSLDDFRDSHTEYFASSFQEYYMSNDSRKRLAFIAPDTYNAMEELINSTISGVN